MQRKSFGWADTGHRTKAIDRSKPWEFHHTVFGVRCSVGLSTPVTCPEAVFTWPISVHVGPGRPLAHDVLGSGATALLLEPIFAAFMGGAARARRLR
ncbi:hypothetical protein GCM10010331_76860 [Streptomyces xanthochromogenes]|nr:hypothetical protein GCM10010331_76860 [Streptomyces xanthochromogenes]